MQVGGQSCCGSILRVEAKKRTSRLWKPWLGSCSDVMGWCFEGSLSRRNYRPGETCCVYTESWKPAVRSAAAALSLVFQGNNLLCLKQSVCCAPFGASREQACLSQ